LGLRAWMRKEVLDQLSEVIDQGFIFVRYMEWLAVLVAFLGLANSMILGVRERRRELALYRAVGMERSQLWRMVLGEAAFTGAAGTVIAVLFGGMLGAYWVRFTLTDILGWRVDYHFPVLTGIFVVASGVLICVAAAWYPAWMAARVDISSGIRED